MQRKQVSFDQIYDVSAVRVVTKSVQECYGVLGAVHSAWNPVPSEFDDYIAMPKPNGYQSLHTVVLAAGRPIEVQIRTEAMHRFAELGVAAHWAYKEARYSKGVDQDRFTVLRQLIDWEKEVKDPAEMVALLRTDVFKDQVYVFTPQGKVIDLPLGATPLDFAYRIHTMVGHRCRGARVNDQIASLDYRLKNGDRVEILTYKEPQPSRDWMNEDVGFLKTSSARYKVRLWFREQGRESNIRAGRDIINREIGRLRLRHVTLSALAERLKYPSVDDLAAAVGYGDRSAGSVASTALGIERELLPKAEEPLPPSRPPQAKPATSGIVIDEVENIQGDRARCCNPVPGDDVVGFVTRGRGVVIHRRDCALVQASREPERLVALRWGANRDEHHTVLLEIQAQGRPGLMAELVSRVATVGADVSSAKSERIKDEAVRIRLGVDCTTAEQLPAVLDRLSSHPDVMRAERYQE
jgi:GTP pyrophosphokinase